MFIKYNFKHTVHEFMNALYVQAITVIDWLTVNDSLIVYMIGWLTGDQ